MSGSFLKALRLFKYVLSGYKDFQELLVWEHKGNMADSDSSE